MNNAAPHTPLKLGDVRRVFRLIGEVRELGSDPKQWRPHMIRRLGQMLGAEIVVSSEIHFRKAAGTGRMRVIDIGWGCDSEGHVWQIHTERQDETPDAYWLLAGKPAPPAGGGARGSSKKPAPAPPPGAVEELVPVKPARPLYGGTCFILSQYALPHAGAVDQLGLHRASGDQPFTQAEHRLVRLFHVELGRLWRKDAIRRAQDPNADLPPRLAQTLEALLEGASEKQIAIKLDLSQHTVHNYVKALHQRFEVSSRGELLAKAGKIRATFLPQLSLPPEKQS
ncbi:helix-turn-helix transcriptional regulator [Fontivita pretiosa]|uniref:helix-turn-helix transcriptional regulator n=1 Tax=Fontivita pretiosa TaxID=2989684 RepID=UPI003D185113